MEIKYKPGELKQYIFLPKSLKMSVGRASSQAAHSSYMARQYNTDETLSQWESSGQTVIVLEANNPEHLIQIEKYCKEWDIKGHLYVDETPTRIGSLIATSFATPVLTPEQQWPFSQFKLFGQKKRWWKRK